MPLRDHFRPPLSSRRHWHSFHNAWATYIAADLNHRLPPGLFAEANVQFGIPAWDTVEVRVYPSEGELILTGVVELVSPGNKARAAQRTSFVSKCAAYVQQGVNLVMVDIVTEPRGNLHDGLLECLGQENIMMNADLYAVAYRPTKRDGKPEFAIWTEALKIGQHLPTLPLWLRGELVLPLELESTYEHTCREYRISSNGS